MEDSVIISMFFNRDEQAIMSAQRKYEKYLFFIGKNFLKNEQDVYECINDCFKKAWDTIPPQNPSMLSCYLGKILRNLCISRLRAQEAKKRIPSAVTMALEELEECVNAAAGVQNQLEQKELVEEINQFLKELSQERRIMFIKRYWYAQNTVEIARELNVSQPYVSKTLKSIRLELKGYFQERGLEV